MIKLGSILFVCFGLVFSEGLVSKPIPVSLNGNELLDLDGNGTLDAVRFTFLGNLDQQSLHETVDSLVFSWADSSGKAVKVHLRSSDFTILPSNSRVLYHLFPQQSRFFSFLTSADTNRFAGIGKATIYCHLPDGKSLEMPVRLQDAMPPVIRKAELFIGKDYTTPDRLSLEFSEAIAVENGSDLRSVLELFRLATRSSQNLEAQKASLVGSRHLVLEFSHSQLGTYRPNSQDSVRIRPNFLVGFRPSQCIAPLCPQRPYSVVLGNMALTLGSSAFGVLKDADMNHTAMEVLGRTFGSGISSESGVGVYLDFGSPDLYQSIRKVMKSRLYSSDSSVIAEQIPVNSAKAYISLSLSIYTNLGAHVVSGQHRVGCQDPLFGGDCIQNPSQIFLRWNGISAEGRKVGSGAYLAKATLQVFYENTGTGSLNIAHQELQEFWGIVRDTDTH